MIPLGEMPDIPPMQAFLGGYATSFAFAFLVARGRATPRRLIGALALIVPCFILYRLAGDVPFSVFLLTVLAQFPLMVLMTRIATSAPWPTCAYWAVYAFIFSQFLTSLEWQVFFYLHSLLEWPRTLLLSFVFALVFFALVITLVTLIERRKVKVVLVIDSRELAIAAMIALIAMMMSYLSYFAPESPFSTSVGAAAFHFRTIGFFGGFAMLFAHDIAVRNRRTFQEMTALQSALSSQYAQFQRSDATITAINIRYHDLKHRLAALRCAGDETRERELAELESLIDEYDSRFKTGNPVVDTILTASALQCRRDGISLTGVVDGSLLLGFDARDIASLLGNALDNAIEAVRTIIDPQRRLIHVTASRVNELCLVRITNPVDEYVPLVEGLPRSTKHDPHMHGYGLRSIRMTAERLHGSMQIVSTPDRFELRILLPLP